MTERMMRAWEEIGLAAQGLGSFPARASVLSCQV